MHTPTPKGVGAFICYNELMNINTLISLKDLPSLRKKYAHKKIVLAGGGFDLIHPGHIKQLQWAKSLGDILVVHITGDKRYFEKRNHKPIFTERERATTIGTMKPVDHVFTYNGRHYDKKILDALAPDILVFNKEAYTDGVTHALRDGAFKGKIKVSKFKKKHSSSSILSSRKNKP